MADESMQTVDESGQVPAAEAAGTAPDDDDAVQVDVAGAAVADGAEDAAGADADPTAAAGAAEADASADAVASDIEALTAKAAKADEYLELAKRTQADFENYRKRTARDAAQAQQRGLARLAKELLPAIDNLERALAAAAADDPLTEGVSLVQSDLLAALARVGIEPFAPAGERFDPTVHEAVAQTAVEGVQTGVVAEVFQAGYRLGDTVLRPARVLVAA